MKNDKHKLDVIKNNYVKINKFEIDTTKESERNYMCLSLKDKKNVISKIMSAYSNEDIERIPPLKEYKSLKRIKSGNFRIIVSIETPTFHKIVRIHDRKEVYNIVKRKEVKYG